jgi:DNA invertase Pin-like site-specific DNA recombinase
MMARRKDERPFKPVIAYIRVSTKQQGKSGLGLEAQQEAIARFAKAEAFDVIETSGPTASSYAPCMMC